MKYNQQQKLDRIRREIKEFNGTVQCTPMDSPRNRATVTRANRCLMRRCRELDKLMRQLAGE